MSPGKSFKPVNITPTKGGLIAVSHNTSMESTSSVQGTGVVNYPTAMFAGEFKIRVGADSRLI